MDIIGTSAAKDASRTVTSTIPAPTAAALSAPPTKPAPKSSTERIHTQQQQPSQQTTEKENRKEDHKSHEHTPDINAMLTADKRESASQDQQEQQQQQHDQRHGPHATRSTNIPASHHQQQRARMHSRQLKRNPVILQTSSSSTQQAASTATTQAGQAQSPTRANKKTHHRRRSSLLKRKGSISRLNKHHRRRSSIRKQTQRSKRPGTAPQRASTYQQQGNSSSSSGNMLRPPSPADKISEIVFTKMHTRLWRSRRMAVVADLVTLLKDRARRFLESGPYRMQGYDAKHAGTLSRTATSIKTAQEVVQLAQQASEYLQEIQRAGETIFDVPLGEKEPPYSKQGNAAYYTPKMLLQREMLVFDKGIQAEIHRFWSTAKLKSSERYAALREAKREFLPKREYVRIFLAIHAALYPEREARVALRLVLEDWQVDSRAARVSQRGRPRERFNASMLNIAQFHRALFELVDHWADGSVEANVYISFLRSLFLRIAEPYALVGSEAARIRLKRRADRLSHNGPRRRDRGKEADKPLLKRSFVTGDGYDDELSDDDIEDDEQVGWRWKRLPMAYNLLLQDFDREEKMRARERGKKYQGVTSSYVETLAMNHIPKKQLDRFRTSTERGESAYRGAPNSYHGVDTFDSSVEHVMAGLGLHALRLGGGLSERVGSRRTHVPSKAPSHEWSDWRVQTALSTVFDIQAYGFDMFGEYMPPSSRLARPHPPKCSQSHEVPRTDEMLSEPALRSTSLSRGRQSRSEDVGRSSVVGARRRLVTASAKQRIATEDERGSCGGEGHGHHVEEAEEGDIVGPVPVSMNVSDDLSERDLIKLVAWTAKLLFDTPIVGTQPQQEDACDDEGSYRRSKLLDSFGIVMEENITNGDRAAMGSHASVSLSDVTSVLLAQYGADGGGVDTESGRIEVIADDGWNDGGAVTTPVSVTGNLLDKGDSGYKSGSGDDDGDDDGVDGGDVGRGSDAGASISSQSTMHIRVVHKETGDRLQHLYVQPYSPSSPTRLCRVQHVVEDEGIVNDRGRRATEGVEAAWEGGAQVIASSQRLRILLSAMERDAHRYSSKENYRCGRWSKERYVASMKQIAASVTSPMDGEYTRLLRRSRRAMATDAELRVASRRRNMWNRLKEGDNCRHAQSSIADGPSRDGHKNSIAERVGKILGMMKSGHGGYIDRVDTSASLARTLVAQGEERGARVISSREQRVRPGSLSSSVERSSGYSGDDMRASVDVTDRDVGADFERMLEKERRNNVSERAYARISRMRVISETKSREDAAKRLRDEERSRIVEDDHLVSTLRQLVERLRIVHERVLKNKSRHMLRMAKPIFGIHTSSQNDPRPAVVQAFKGKMYPRFGTSIPSAMRGRRSGALSAPPSVHLHMPRGSCAATGANVQYDSDLQAYVMARAVMKTGGAEFAAEDSTSAFAPPALLEPSLMFKTAEEVSEVQVPAPSDLGGWDSFSRRLESGMLSRVSSGLGGRGKACRLGQCVLQSSSEPLVVTLDASDICVIGDAKRGAPGQLSVERRKLMLPPPRTSKKTVDSRSPPSWAFLSPGVTKRVRWSSSVGSLRGRAFDCDLVESVLGKSSSGSLSARGATRRPVVRKKMRPPRPHTARAATSGGRDRGRRGNLLFQRSLGLNSKLRRPHSQSNEHWSLDSTPMPSRSGTRCGFH